MKKLISLIFASIFLLSSSFSVFADDPAAGCAVGGCMFAIWAGIMLVALGIGIAIIVFIFKWIKKDAKSRGMPNADSVCFLALLGLLGLLIYVLTRPQGNVFACQHCGMMRMQGLPQCPHCGRP